VTTPPSHGFLPRLGRRIVDAYTGEHGVYGLVLVTALIAIGDDYDDDLEVLVYVVGTTIVFWLAHVYAGIVAAGGHAELARGSLLRQAGHAAGHSWGMLLAMLPPAIVLGLGVIGLVDEDEAYDFALISGLIVLALIGWANARRNGRRWPLQIVGALATTTLGALVILLSILVH
jgi:hypothetical protein